jgi:hypothetical protein
VLLGLENTHENETETMGTIAEVSYISVELYINGTAVVGHQFWRQRQQIMSSPNLSSEFHFSSHPVFF